MATYSERVRRKLADLKTILGVWMLSVPKGLYIISKKPLPFGQRLFVGNHEVRLYWIESGYGVNLFQTPNHPVTSSREYR
jgi:hypothetical protein